MEVSWGKRSQALSLTELKTDGYRCQWDLRIPERVLGMLGPGAMVPPRQLPPEDPGLPTPALS
jgi:hypothetical protein